MKEYKYKSGFWVYKRCEKTMDKILVELAESYVFEIKKKDRKIDKDFHCIDYWLKFNIIEFWRMVGIYQEKSELPRL